MENRIEYWVAIDGYPIKRFHEMSSASEFIEAYKYELDGTLSLVRLTVEYLN